MIAANIEQVEYALKHALERHEEARLNYAAIAQGYMRGVGETEQTVAAHRALGLARVEVENARLHLQLIAPEDGKERVFAIESEHRRLHLAASRQVPERINDLGILEDAESELLDAEVRFQEADRSFHSLGDHFKAGRIGPGDMLLVITELCEAEAARKIAQARVDLIKQVDGTPQDEQAEDAPVM